MKKTIAILLSILALTLSSCQKAPSAIENKYIFQSLKTGESDTWIWYRINVETGIAVPLCPDPLCSHTDEDCLTFNLYPSATLGSKMYCLHDPDPRVWGGAYHEVCIFDTMSGKHTVIYRNESAGTVTDLYAFEEYAYYIEYVADKDGDSHYKIFRYDTKTQKIKDLGKKEFDGEAYAFQNGRLYWRDHDHYYSTDADCQNIKEDDRFGDDRKHAGDYALEVVRGEKGPHPVINQPYTYSVISHNIKTDEKATVIEGKPFMPFVYGSYLFYFEYQEEPLVVGHFDDTGSPVYDPRGFKLYMCDFDGGNARLLCDIEGSGYRFHLENMSKDQLISEKYIALQIVTYDKDDLDHQRTNILIVNIETGEYKIAELA